MELLRLEAEDHVHLSEHPTYLPGAIGGARAVGVCPRTLPVPSVGTRRLLCPPHGTDLVGLTP